MLERPVQLEADCQLSSVSSDGTRSEVAADHVRPPRSLPSMAGVTSDEPSSATTSPRHSSAAPRARQIGVPAYSARIESMRCLARMASADLPSPSRPAADPW